MMMDASNPAQVTILPPSDALKQRIGEMVAIEHIFSATTIANAQMVLHREQGHFLEWISGDMHTLHSHHFAASQCLKRGDPAPLAAIGAIARTIHAQAGTVGFTLGADIARLLMQFCARHPVATAYHLLLVHKHIEALDTIFMRATSGDGGDTGQALARALATLGEKYD